MMALFEGGCAKHATLVGDMMIRHGIFGPNIIYIYIVFTRKSSGRWGRFVFVI
jgi:hypothetical protein